MSKLNYYIGLRLNTSTVCDMCDLGENENAEHFLLYFIIHTCDPTVVICYLIWPCDIAVCITYLISHSSSLSYNTVIKEYFRLGV